MAKSDPKEIIMEALRTAPIPEGFQARKGIIQFFRSRLLPHSQLHEVTFENSRGEHQRFLCLVVQEPDGIWNMVLSYNISGINHVRSEDEPHVVLGGSNPWMGGYVVDCGQEVTHVRLVSRNGNILEDTVQDGLVVFTPEQGIPLPIEEIELYDSAGNLVNTHLWPYMPPTLRARFSQS